MIHTRRQYVTKAEGNIIEGTSDKLRQRVKETSTPKTPSAILKLKICGGAGKSGDCVCVKPRRQERRRDHHAKENTHSKFGAEVDRIYILELQMEYK